MPSERYGFARLCGYYYNDSRGPGSGQGYNGFEGDVFAALLLLEHDDGQPKAAAWVYRSNDADGTDWTRLFDEEFPITIDHNTEYTLSIEFTGSTLTFKCNNLAPIIYNIQTPTYDPSVEWMGLQSRVTAAPGDCGLISTTFDDVYVAGKPFPWTMFIPAITGSGLERD